MSNSLGPHGLYSHGILQANILEWVAFPFSRGAYPNPGIEPRSPALRVDSYQLSYQGSPIKARYLDRCCDLTNLITVSGYFYYPYTDRLRICSWKLEWMNPVLIGSPTNFVALNIPKYQPWGRTAHNTPAQLSRPITCFMYWLKTTLLGCC